MLLFIKVTKQDDNHVLIFQNILCYCLSISGSWSSVQALLFQNILCYCLSGSVTKNAAGIEISKHLMLLFIASGTHAVIFHIHYFKTSYVIVYLNSSILPSAISLNFKTSYVIVYRLAKH